MFESQKIAVSADAPIVQELFQSDMQPCTHKIQSNADYKSERMTISIDRIKDSSSRDYDCIVPGGGKDSSSIALAKKLNLV